MNKVLLQSIFLIYLALTHTLAYSAEITYIDRRTNKESHDYAVVFSAKDGELGHAFVTIVWTDEKPLATLQKSIGFYPAAAESKAKILSGLSEGALFDDTKTDVDITLSVLVDKTQYERALAVITEWEKPSTYFMGLNDCTSFVQDVSDSIGLEVPNRALAPYPYTFVQELINKNP